LRNLPLLVPFGLMLRAQGNLRVVGDDKNYRGAHAAAGKSM